MQITINETTYIATRKMHDWRLEIPTLSLIKEGKNKGKQAYVSLYYANFSQVAKAIIDREIGNCEDLKEIKLLLETLKERLDDKTSTFNQQEDCE